MLVEKRARHRVSERGGAGARAVSDFDVDDVRVFGDRRAHPFGQRGAGLAAHRAGAFAEHRGRRCQGRGRLQIALDRLLFVRHQ